MVQFLAGLRKIKLHTGAGCFKSAGPARGAPSQAEHPNLAMGKKASKSSILDKDESTENENNIVV